jgi:hypothetical protein
MSSTVSIPKPKQSQPTTRSYPSTTTATTTTSKPNPFHTRRASVPHVDVGSTPTARRYSSALLHHPDPDPDPDPTPKPRRVSSSATDQKSRNRVAASKCRLKTKAAISRLETEERAASEQNATLAAAVARLREETYVLRSQLLMHTDCRCKLIQQFLCNRAKELGDAARREGAGERGGGRGAIEMEMGRRGSGQWKERRWDDNDSKRDEVFGSGDDGDYGSGEEEE